MDCKHVHRLDAEVVMLNGLFLVAAPRPHEDTISVTFLWIPPADSDHVVSTALKPFPPERRAQTVLEGLSPGFDLMEIGADQVNGKDLHLVISQRVGLDNSGIGIRLIAGATVRSTPISGILSPSLTLAGRVPRGGQLGGKKSLMSPQSAPMNTMFIAACRTVRSTLATKLSAGGIAESQK